MANAGYKASVRIASDSVAVVDYVMADTGDGLTWRGSTSHNYAWDPSVVVVVKVDGVVEDAANYTFDYAMGLITFTSTQAGSAVRLTGSRLYLNDVIDAQSYSVSITVQELDDTVLQDEAVSRIGGLFDVTGTISRLSISNIDHDPDGGREVKIFDVMTSRGYKLLEMKPNDDTGQYWVIRVWARFFGEEVSASVSDLSTAVLTFNGTIPTANVDKSFGWGSTAPSN